jgi:tRNA-dihydrouridine synthase
MDFSLRSDADLNLGCPQDIAREEHFGAYLLGKKDWSLVQSIGEQKLPKNYHRKK